MSRPKFCKNKTLENKKKNGRIFYLFAAVISLLAIAMLSGCSVKDVIGNSFGKEAAEEKENNTVTSENNLLYAQVNDAAGRALVKSNGEPLTVLVAYETATGGEPRINSDGVLETHAMGEVETYASGSPVELSDGTIETYAGGEIVTDILGQAKVDENGNYETRSSGETVTHGNDEIVYDENGERSTYQGEPLTYAAGEQMYETDGERATYAVTIRRNLAGEIMTEENGGLSLSGIELMTDESGNPIITTDGEAATKQLDPEPPAQVVDMPFEEGQYYINNITSPFVFFSTPEVEATNVAVVTEDDVDPSQYYYESGEGLIHNLQLEILGQNLTPLSVHFDAEGYAYFVDETTSELLTLAGDLRNGVNVLLKEMDRQEYPQYEYWDEPLYTVADNQKWIIKAQSDGTYTICSAVDENYVMTVDDQFGTQYANIMVWEYDGRDLQKFNFTTEEPKIENSIKEGTYYIRAALSDWQMISIGDDNYEQGSEIYIYSSDMGNGQAYTIKYDEYGFATITHADSSLALSVAGSSAVTGAYICQYEADGGDWQKWILDENEDGTVIIRSALNVSEVWDVPDGDTKNGIVIMLHWNNDSKSQNWGILEEAIPSAYAYDTMDSYAQNFSSETQYLILVSSGMNTVGVYTGSKGNWTSLYYWICTTGKSSTPTVSGEFTVYNKLYSFDGNMDSPAWYTCYYATGFYPQYFFHTIIYYRGTWDIMDSSLGWNASHGCVRLATENAQWLYDNITYGTKVVSY